MRKRSTIKCVCAMVSISDGMVTVVEMMAIEWYRVVFLISMRMVSITMGVMSVGRRVMSMEVGEMSMAR